MKRINYWHMYQHGQNLEHYTEWKKGETTEVQDCVISFA